MININHISLPEQAITPDRVVKLVDVLCKSMGNIERCRLKCYLIRKHVSWMTLSAIAPIVGCKNRWAVQYNIQAIENSVDLMKLAEDFDTLLEVN